VKHGFLKEIVYRNSWYVKENIKKIFGPTKELNGLWRIKTNKELYDLIKR
jgi:hypothetical protein